MPDDELRVELGETLVFYNEGGIAHTVTIPEYGVDEVIQLEKTVAVVSETPLQDALIDCRFHKSHDAILTVE